MDSPRFEPQDPDFAMAATLMTIAGRDGIQH
jgi:hypothetical protein